MTDFPWIYVAILVLAALALAPLALTLRRRGMLRSRRDSALDVHRAQLIELDRDRDQGRIGAAEHASAVLEVQRRILAADAANDAAADIAPRGTGALVLSLALVPLAAIGLYLIGGHPELPGEPLSTRLAAADAQFADTAGLVVTLREKLPSLDPKSPMAWQGYVMLGNAEDSLGHSIEAVTAWRTALANRFDPTLAAQTAEMQARIDGKVTPQTAAMFRAALAAAPPDAPWRDLVARRLGQGSEEGK